MMDAKTYLSQARHLNNQIKSYELELEYVNNLALGPTGPNYQADTLPSTVPQLKSSFQIYLAKVHELENIISDEINKLLKLKEEIMRTIAKINNPRLELVLRERYVNCRNWEDIGHDLNFSKVYLYKLHRDGLNLIEVPQEYSKV